MFPVLTSPLGCKYDLSRAISKLDAGYCRSTSASKAPLVELLTAGRGSASLWVFLFPWFTAGALKRTRSAQDLGGTFESLETGDVLASVPWP